MLKQRAIGLALDTVGQYGREVIHGVMEFCHRNPHWVIAVAPRLWIYDEEPEPYLWNVDGLIIQAYSQDVVDRVRAAKIPAMNVANMGKAVSPLNTVVPDDLAIGKMAAEYLLSLGLPHYGYCAHNAYEFSILRGNAFRQQMELANADFSECDTATQNLDEWLKKLRKPAGVFCCNDAWAHRTLSAARRCDIRVPDQIAVLGVDDDELLNTVGALPLSSIAIPAAKIGFEAARFLEGMLNGVPAPQLTMLSPLCVVPRATTDTTIVDDPDVATALAFIKANVARPTQVEDVVANLSISRRSLERRFQESIGRSIAAEIRRSHIERAKQMLIQTTLSIDEVAQFSGFTSATLLGVIFRKHVGVSPSEFRQRNEVSNRNRKTGAF